MTRGPPAEAASPDDSRRGDGTGATRQVADQLRKSLSSSEATGKRRARPTASVAATPSPLVGLPPASRPWLHEPWPGPASASLVPLDR